MCLHPIEIKNNSHHFDESRLPIYYTVPCGHCEECRKARRSEWFVRAYYHWLGIKDRGGCCYFYTLTYNEDNLPMFMNIPTFSREDIVNFCKRLKMRLKRKFNVDFSYLITCEYGTLFHRPHYHALFYVSQTLMPWSFYNEVEAAWQKGFVYAGSNGGIMTSSDAILYVTKYITKDDAYEKEDRDLFRLIRAKYSKDYNEWRKTVYCHYPVTFQELLIQRNRWTDVPEVADWYRRFYKEYRDRVPFNAHSTQFGAALQEDFLKSCVNLRDDSVRIPQGHEYVYVPLPRYLKRKFYYDTVPNEKDGKCTRYVLNEDGKRHFLDTLDSRIDSLAKNVKEIFATRMTDYQLKVCTEDCLLKFETRRDYERFMDVIQDVDCRKVAIYAKVYRNRFDTGQPYDYWREYKQYLKDAMDIVEDKADRPITHDRYQFAFLHNNMFNFSEEFEPYEYLFDLYHHMKKVLGEERAAIVKEQNDKQRQLRDMQKITRLQIVKNKTM